MDELTVREDQDLQVRWPGGGGFQQVEMCVNGRPLLDVIRELELPHAEKEWDERVGSGDSEEDLGARGARAGDYLYLPPAMVFSPSKNLFGEPYNHGFLTEPDEPCNRKSLLLSCTCGITDCWFLLAEIVVEDQFVVWRDFEQFHRDWSYQGLEFRFERQQYFDVLGAS